MNHLMQEISRARQWQGAKLSGRVVEITGLLIESIGPNVSVGEMCYVYGKQGKRVLSQVIGFRENRVQLMAFGELIHITAGSEVWPKDEEHLIPVSCALTGRILNALGNPIDGKGPIAIEKYYPVTAPPISPFERETISAPFLTGIKAIDGLLTMSQGGRLGIFSGSGVGKSTLMGMIARKATADINVIALIGERGREVREFIERNLGLEGLKRSVVIVATSDECAALRSQGAHIATTIAEYFRDAGKEVLLMMDSITRYAHALRQIGLANGEPSSHHGYPPSVFAKLPTLVERAGKTSKGSITALYTILTEGNDMNDPLGDQMRSLLDGHFFLSRDLALAQHFPPIDIVNSLSRLMSRVVSEQHEKKASRIRQLMKIYRDAEELIHIGAYVKGSNPKIDLSLEKQDVITRFLKQNLEERFSFEKILQELEKI